MELFASTGNWVEALGKTLIHSIWISLLIYSLLRILLHSVPDRYSDLRYKMALISMLGVVVSVTGLFFLLYTPEIAIKLNDKTEGSYALLSFLQKNKTLLPQGPDVQLPYVICTYIYLAGIPIVLIRSAISIRYLRFMRKSGTPVQEDWLVRFNLLKTTLGIQRKVAFLETKKLNTPALIGFMKPVVLIPAGMLTNLSVSQVETILLHELFHLRRFDTLVNVVQVIIENLLFFNPAVWALSKLVRHEREKCCDDRVIGSCENPLIYAKALYQLAGKDHQLSKLAPGAGGSDQIQLYTRIKRILNQHAMKNNIRERLFSFLILAGGLLIMLTVTGFSSSLPIVKDNEAWQKASFAQNPVSISQDEPAPLPLAEPAPLPLAEPAPAIETEAIFVPAVLPLADTVPHVDWEEIKKEMEEARMEVMEEMAEIDWEEIKVEMEEARALAMEDIDWEKIQEEIEEARTKMREELEEIDWEEIRIEMEGFEINLDSLKMDMDVDFDMDIDIEKIKEEVNRSLEDIDWEGMKVDMARAKVHLDSVLQDLDMDFDLDFDSEEEE
jgi:beta-lactamase regulating signal transducer with metallopeptidase domain